MSVKKRPSMCKVCDKECHGTKFRCKTCVGRVFDLCRKHYNKRGMYHPMDHEFAEYYEDEEIPTRLKHYRFECDLCRAHPLIGTRFSCESCQSFDICENCYATSKKEYHLDHHHHHKFIANTIPNGVGKKVTHTCSMKNKKLMRFEQVINRVCKCDGKYCDNEEFLEDRKRFHKRNHRFRVVYRPPSHGSLPLDTIAIICSFISSSKILNNLFLATNLEYYLQREHPIAAKNIKFGYFRNPRRVLRYVYRLVIIRSPRDVSPFRNFPNLRSLKIINSPIKSIPKIETLSSMVIKNCENMPNFFRTQNAAQLFPRLTKLKILCDSKSSDNVIKVSRWIGEFANLERLELLNCELVSEIGVTGTNEFVSGLERLVTLKFLRIQPSTTTTESRYRRNRSHWDVSRALPHLSKLVTLELDHSVRFKTNSLRVCFDQMKDLKYLVVGEDSIEGGKEKLIKDVPQLEDQCTIQFVKGPVYRRRYGRFRRLR